MKVGVIGLGSIGGRHAFNLEKLGHEVLGYDKNGTGSCKHLEEALKADAFVIATPIKYHHELLGDIGDKPIFMEKPVSDHLSPFVTENVLKKVKMVGYNLRFHSCVLKAKGWIDAGHLGHPLWANFVCGQKNKKYKEHVVLNWSHEIDLALYLLGPANVATSYVTPSIADIILLGAAPVTIHLDYCTEPEIRQFIIVGNKASIIVEIPHRYAQLRDASGTKLEEYGGQDDWDDNYVDEMETFIARCQGMNTAGATAEDGLAVTKICLDAIERSKQ